MPVTFTELKVGRSTFMRWARMFSDLQRIYTVPIRAVDNIPALASLPSHMQFSGLELLLDIGLACTRPEVTDDPERLFALLRYATKISSNTPNLKLARHVSDMDPHKKKVLSDEFGCGFAFLGARRLLNTNILLDTTTARRRGLLTTAAPKSQQPDYIGMNDAGGLLVLEAKGTQTRGYCRKQVRTGCDQVTQVNFTNGSSATRVAIGAELRREDHSSNTTVFVGDPEEKDGQEYAFTVLTEEAIVRSHYARIAALIGDAELLGSVIEYRQEDKSDLQKHTVQQRVYVGSTFQFRHRSSVVGLFVGLDRDFRRRIMAAQQHKYLLTDGRASQEPEPPNIPERFIRRPDGTVLQLWAKGPLAGELGIK